MLFCEAMVPEEPARCCFFFFAKSYMSPKMPAKVLRRFFMVSSASSTTDDCCWGRAGDGWPRVEPDWDDCDAWESRRPTLDKSDGSAEAPLKLPWRAMEPTPGVCLSGIGGGAPAGWEKLPEMLRMPADIGGLSSVGLPVRELTVGRDCDFGNGGRQTF